MLALLDRYLLGEPVSKPVLLSTLLSERSSLPAAAPFYRALEAVGVRAADEAFIALRLVLAGREPSDDAVRHLRALGALARAAAQDDAAAVKTLLRKEGTALDLEPPGAPFDGAAYGATVRAAYGRALV